MNLNASSRGAGLSGAGNGNSLRSGLLGVLSLLEPLAGLVGVLGGLGLVACLIYKAGSPRIHFPLYEVLGISVGLLLLAGAYVACVRALEGDSGGQ